MRIMQINSTFGLGSTGKICRDISIELSRNNVPNRVLYTIGNSGDSVAIKCSNGLYTKAQALKSKSFGNYGFNSKASTRKMIHEIKSFRPDIIHLHNIHSHDCNLEMLFGFFKNSQQRLIWTLHDCWALTGYCSHFTMVGCNKWTTCCMQCPQRKAYSFLLDRSSYLFEKKKELFLGLDLTITTPSRWLEGLVKASFLQDYRALVVHNGVDLNVFRPIESDFRARHSIPPKVKLLLGVAYDWSVGKGLDVFIKLAEELNPDKYQIVLVGLNKDMLRRMSSNIIAIERTRNQRELVEAYSSADLLINPTREEVFGLVNIESLACGTPVVAFDTGGCPEIIDETCGSVIDVNDIEAMAKEIIRICEKHPYTKEACTTKARAFDKKNQIDEFVSLYRNLCE